MKKKFSLLFLILLVMLVFSGCSKEKVDTSKLNIVTSFYPMYLATANIVDGIEEVELRNLTATATGCLHDYQLTTANMITLSTADIFIINGGGMETFLNKVIDNYQSLRIINASEGVLEAHEEIENEKKHDHDLQGEHEHGENAHIWVSISLYIKEVENIRNALMQIDAKNAKKYQENAEVYIQELKELKEKMHEALDKVENKKIVTFHEAFEFFAEEFDLEIVSVIEREPGTYPSAREVANIIELIREKDVRAIFVEPQYSRSAADTIARETGVPVYSLDPVVTGGLKKEAYIEIMERN